MNVESSFGPETDDSPPRTNTRVPTAAMRWPDLTEGAGPIFWNMYHL